MNKENWFRKEHIMAGTLLLLVLFINIHYLHMKSGYFVDEGMTLFLANGNYNGAVTSKSDSTLYDFVRDYVIRDDVSGTIDNISVMLKQLTSAGNYSEEGTVEWYDAARNLLQGQRVWMYGSELFEQLTVSESERFQYGQVYLNQAMDVHPPLYYLIVHTVFSLFPGSYSDAYLFGINIIALLMTCVILYKMAGLLSDNCILPLLTIIIYGFSQGFVSCAVYFRMYALLSFFTTLTVYLHLIWERNNYRYSKRLSVAMVMGVIFGFYTHYYYIILLFPLFLVTALRLLRRKRGREFAGYIKNMVTAGLISFLIWPFSVYHILFGYRGTEAAANLVSDGLIGRIRVYYEIISKAFFYEQVWLFAIILAAGIFFIFVAGKKKSLKYLLDKEELGILFIIAFYLAVICQIAPSQSDRYIMCVYPMISLLVSRVTVKILEKGLKEKHAACSNVSVILSGIILANSFWMNVPNYLYLERRKEELGIKEDLTQMNCLMITDDDWRGFSEALKLCRFKQVIVLGERELDRLETEKPEDRNNDLLIYVLAEADQKENLRVACEYLGGQCDRAESVSSDIENFQAYVLEREEE